MREPSSRREGGRRREREGGPAEPETGWEKKSGGTNKSVFPLHMPTVRVIRGTFAPIYVELSDEET